MRKGKMAIGQEVYRNLFKIIRDSFNMEEVLSLNPYKSENYRDLWDNVAWFLWSYLKPVNERVTEHYSQKVFDRFLYSMDGLCGDESLYALKRYYLQDIEGRTPVEKFWYEQIQKAYHYGWDFDIDILFCRTEILKYNRRKDIEQKEQKKDKRRIVKELLMQGQFIGTKI